MSAEPDDRQQPTSPQVISEGLSESIPAVVPRGGRFEGLLAFRGSARIEGELRGEIIAEGALHIGATGRVEARVQADEVFIAGDLQGDIAASQRIELCETASVIGTLSTPRLVMAEGSVLRGRCLAGRHPDLQETSRADVAAPETEAFPS